jgi:dephospho-CoA kinase
MQRAIALTGGIASGKTLVGDYLAARGVPVIDADAVVHRLLREDAALKARIRDTFGEGVFDADGFPDRRKLAAIVFPDAERRHLLEQWIHPAVREEISAFFRQQADQPVVVAVIPLLFESGLENAYPEIWLMVSEEDEQRRRLEASRRMSREDALARIRSQMPLAEKQKRLAAHGGGHLIHNGGTAQDVYRRVDALLALK